MMNLWRIAAGGGSLHLWERGMKMARMAPASSFPYATSAKKPANRRRQIEGAFSPEKNSTLEKLRSLMGETLDFIMREEEKKGAVSFTHADLITTAEQLDKEGKHDYAFEILEWMDRKKMSFSPKELQLFVGIIAKVKGLDAAEAYFKKVDPNFKQGDPARSKNYPAFARLVILNHEFEFQTGVRQWRCSRIILLFVSIAMALSWMSVS
ncbi:PREDICTED: pentatricopeptide repeat-containing protein At1g02370, mitochondrial-like [Camelina sativa]|uniref:Pentatricopeptide repeat-containing protein At1g02370, mitochondrial-like n=1 Tax=Camelina sativa TaxID=90675 RepID=A0ABM0Y6M4_CAMSA|nr:PREDICTED: pentatricopeptide repeat-containing protein At1g02370, mitochondrial-like [Camelina sativa]